MKAEYKKWTLDQIKSNPKLFGGDSGNPAIIKQYLTKLHGNTKACDLTLEAISQSVAVSRTKNKLLKKYKQYDFRVKNRPKYKREM